MTDRKFKKQVLKASALSAKGKESRAFALFEKLSTDSPDLTAYLNFHRAICEERRKNYTAAAELFKQCAEYYVNAKQNKLACTSYILLGNVLCSEKKYDPACEAYLSAERLTDESSVLCEIKTLCSEARMYSDTVYDTALFIEPCEYIRQLAKNGTEVNTDLFIRSCLIAAQACSAVRLERACAEYCYLGIELAAEHPESKAQEQAFECAVLLCRGAIQTWNDILISHAAAKSYDFKLNRAFKNDKSDHLSLLYALTLLKEGEKEEAALVLKGLDKQSLSAENSMYMQYCESLFSGEDFALDCDSVPRHNLDEFFLFAESAVDKGFPTVAAEIYECGLSLYSECRTLVLRPYASLLYRLERYSESAHCYSELAENPDPVLSRAYSLASLHAGDTETAKQQMLLYIDNAEDKEKALSLAAGLSMDENYPPEFCASLYARLAALLEKHGESTEEIVDVYNRLGICLYRSVSPVEAERNAFKKAASHAEACEATKNTNLHAVIISNLAECYLRDGDIDECYEYYLKADSIFSGLDDIDTIQYTTCLKFIADILLIRDDKEAAAETLKKAVALLEPQASSDPAAARQLSLCRNALGTVYFKLGKPELEVLELTKAIDLVREHPIDDASLALLYSNRGEAYERMGKYNLMAEDYAMSLSLTENSGEAEQSPHEQLSRAAKWLSIGRYREDSLQHENAISAYKTALELLDSLPVSDDSDVNELAAFAYYQLGNAYCHGTVRDFTSSLAAYSRSLSILENLPSNSARKFHLASTYDARAAFYEVFGEHPLAVADYRKADALRNEALAEE